MTSKVTGEGEEVEVKKMSERQTKAGNQEFYVMSECSHELNEC